MVLLLLSIVMPSKYLNDSTYIPKQKRSKGYKLMRELWHITTNAAHRVVCACELKLQGSRKESIQKHTKRSKYFRCMQAVAMEVGAANKQGEHDTLTTHVKNVKALYNVIRHYQGDLIDKDAIEAEKKLDDKLDDKAAAEKARNRILKLGTIKACKYPKVYADIKKEYLYKNNVYPKDSTKGFEQIQHHIAT